MAARSFPGATYLWHLPDGSTKAGREIEFDATTASAGTYVVDIHLTTCTVTLTANIKVKIASINEAAGLTLNQQACAGEPVEFTLDPAEAEINGVAADEDEIEYNGSELQLRTIRSRGSQFPMHRIRTSRIQPLLPVSFTFVVQQ